MDTFLQFIWIVSSLGSFAFLNNVSKKISFQNELAEKTTALSFIVLWFLFMIFMGNILGVEFKGREY